MHQNFKKIAKMPSPNQYWVKKPILLEYRKFGCRWKQSKIADDKENLFIVGR